MSVLLKDKWAMVTGSSRGVGLRVAKGLAALGCKVVLHARTKEATDELARELRDVGYPGSMFSLVYDPSNDRIVGFYYHAVSGQNFDVVFIRQR